MQLLEMGGVVRRATLAAAKLAYPVILFGRCLNTRAPSFLPVLLRYFAFLATVSFFDDMIFKGTDANLLLLAGRTAAYIALQWIIIDRLGLPFGLARGSAELPSRKSPRADRLRATYLALWNDLPRPGEDSGPSD
jgi:hypothetical protein